ncbi:Flagellar protein flgJ [Borrelia miyamotoi]|uniref:Rod-binding protein n=1 Tax=Borrelia miyamotoi TaxID=47466 RepID=A0AAP9CFB8_9SPIR|nr:rod-binding protein [Borrelia miyamotoi]AHH04627.1 Flagellar protein flgJ [Borrelia miyamotoi FR64b]ATQ14496.1 rod-binding protein [Borrelia miyamotoi]ATQ15681.1 rod-binding protein [Borrelia miyamotoi]ATQ16825.1 rod-binding protein [Borrelia miyamotoi]ATQ18672.1 rod-binding protein [Borrelia miyamotoi]
MINKINLQILETKNQIKQIKNLKTKVQEKTNQHKNNLKIYTAALEFETIFIEQMLKSIKNSLKKENNLINGGQTEEIFEDMLYSERAKQIAKSKSFRLADLISNQIAEVDNSRK